MVKPMGSLPPSSSSSSLRQENSEEIIKYRGVRKRKWGKWVSEIRLPNSRERIWLGSFDNAEKAAKAFDAALFCLRGENAMFNFPDNPPNIVGGQSLTPQEIQHVASQFANNEEEEKKKDGREEDHQPCIRSNENDGNGVIMEEEHNEGGIDWSFLNMMELDDGNVFDVTKTIPDYSLYSGIDRMIQDNNDDMYMPQLVPSKDEDNGGEEDGDGIEDGNIGGDLSSPYSLWNF
ncbi:DNA-binding transcription factor [Lithospermum erythrorhizon]|uniref:DNA-binding transcription factor n=1 Tax=Lithospermum erythrorhizon TaxID=34254 RepID=A0AAV3QBG7_LITER